MLLKLILVTLLALAVSPIARAQCPGGVCYRPATTYTYAYAPPAVAYHYLVDDSGQSWHHADLAWLQTHVASENARLAKPRRSAKPVFHELKVGDVIPLTYDKPHHPAKPVTAETWKAGDEAYVFAGTTKFRLHSLIHHPRIPGRVWQVIEIGRSPGNELNVPEDQLHRDPLDKPLVRPSPQSHTYGDQSSNALNPTPALDVIHFTGNPAPTAYVTGDPYGFTSWLNNVRAQNGRGPVRCDPGLSGQAAVNNTYGYGHRYMGSARRQNWGMGAGSTVWSRWMGSPDHQSALLDPTITTIGIAFDGSHWTYNAY